MKKSVYLIAILFSILPAISFSQRQSLPLATFKSIEVKDNLNIFFTQGTTHTIDIEAPDELLTGITADIDKKGVLRFIISKNAKKASLENTKIYIVSPVLEGIAMNGSSVLTLETDITSPKVSFDLSGNAIVNARKITGKSITFSMKDNAIFRGILETKSIKGDFRGQSKTTFSGALNDVKISLKGNAIVTVEKLTGKKLMINAAENAAPNINFEGKNIKATSAGNSVIQLSGTASKGFLDAKGNSVIDIRRLTGKNIKTTTQGAGVIER